MLKRNDFFLGNLGNTVLVPLLLSMRALKYVLPTCAAIEIQLVAIGRCMDPHQGRERVAHVRTCNVELWVLSMRVSP